MKKVFTAPSIVECDMVRARLDASGIPSMIKNENSSIYIGAYPTSTPYLPFAWPEIWVGDEDFEKASAIIVEYQSESASESGDQDAVSEDPKPRAEE